MSEREPVRPNHERRHVRAEVVASLALALLLVTVVPITLRRPLTGDSSIWNVIARLVEHGAVPYVDLFETNPPGTLWIHRAVHAVLGHTSEALRAFDLLAVGTAILLLAGWIVRSGRPRVVAVWASVAFVACYASQSIWCQCQRDVWMLAFAVGGCALRRKALAGTGRSALLAGLEGVLWGMAASMKPFVLLAWLGVEWAERGRPWRSYLAWGAGFGFVAAANVVAVVSWGAWPAAVAIWSDWNAEYFAARTRLWNLNGLRMLAHQFGPWFAIHLLGLPLAGSVVIQRSNGTASRNRRALAALYLGWMFQAFVLQHWHAYVHVPGLLLGLAFVATEPSLTAARAWVPAVLVFATSVALWSPPVHVAQLRVWPSCFGSSIAPATRDVLRGPLDTVYPAGPTWTDLQPVRDFLEPRVADGGLLCYGFSTAALYDELGVAPACRFATPRFHALFFPERRATVLAAIESSSAKYVVTDLVMAGVPESQAESTRLAENAGFPWGHPVVFRSGRYVVHRLERPLNDFTRLARTDEDLAPSTTTTPSAPATAEER